MNWKDIIFDVDGTLWDTTEIVADSWNCAAKELGYEVETITGKRLEQEFGKPMDVIARDLFPQLSTSQQEELMDACCRLEHQFLEDTAKNMLYPGIRETLTALSASHRLYIVSNCQSGYIELFLKKTQMESLICDIECFGNTKKSKGENIRLLMERNQISNACYVGDTMGDFQAAKDAGLPFVLASYGFGEVPDADYRISHIEELPALIRSARCE